MTANPKASKFRTYFTKLFHNLLPTLYNLHKFKPLLYPHDICNRCHLSPETNDHLWTCPNSQNAIKSILLQSTIKLEKILKSYYSSQHNQSITFSLNSIINNFYNYSYFLKNALLSSSIDHKPGYIYAFKGFVVKELTDFFKSLNIPSSHASKLSAKFTIWFAKQGFTQIWLVRCKNQIEIEKSNSIFAKHKRSSKKRSGRSTNTTTSSPINNIYKTHMETDLCKCKFPASNHINNQCPEEGLANIQGDTITSLIHSLQAENDLFINPIGFS